MDKEDLIAMGLTEEQAIQVLTTLEKNFVAKTSMSEINEENKTLKQLITDRDKQLESLKKSSDDNSELKKQIETLQQQNAEQKKAHDAELGQLKLDHAVDAALIAAGAKNARAVKALFDMEKVKLDANGELTGLDEQMKALQKSDAYLFNDKQANKTTFRGFQPGVSGEIKPGTRVDMSKMTYEELASYIESNPDTE